MRTSILSFRVCTGMFLVGMSLSAWSASPASQTEVTRYAEALLAKTYADDGPGAAVLVARGDVVLYRGARGRGSIELGLPLSADHVFRIGSVTKQFSAAGLLKLAEEGKLTLDDPLTKFVPGYPNGDKVTVRMLLNHTSGIRSYTSMPGVMEGPIQKDVTTAQLIDTFKNEKPDFAPGDGWDYNNSGYVLVGAVIEAASGMPWHAYLKQALFAPLGMTHTGYGNEAVAVIPGHVSGYTLVEGKPAVAFYLSMTQPHAAGALVSTVDDLLRWNRALHEGRVLESGDYRQMITPVGKAADEHYGFGIVHGTLRGADLLQHGGGIFGFSTYLLYLAGSDTTVAVLHNADADPDGSMPPSDLARRMAAYTIGNPYPEEKAISIDAATLASYEGVYRVDAETARVLRVVDGHLTAQRTGGQRARLVPIAKDAFVYENRLTRFEIERAGAGAITGMRFHEDGADEGIFVARTKEPLPVERKATDVPRAARERLVGRYAHQGMSMTVSLQGDTLSAQLAGQPAFELFAESPTRFFVKVVDATLEFKPGDAPPSSVTLHQGGQVLDFKRAVD